MISVKKGTYNCNTFFHFFAFFFILNNLLNKKTILYFFEKLDFRNSKQEKKVPFLYFHKKTDGIIHLSFFN